jgi:hypothetical protein
MKVDVYKNLHLDLFSVKARQGKKRGRVISHEFSIVLEDVEFIVRESGRQKVIKEKRKNVHAFARGTVKKSQKINKNGLERISYNPYLYPYFYSCETHKPVYKAGIVLLNADGVWIKE